MSSGNNITAVKLRSITETLDFITSEYIHRIPLVFTIIGTIGFIGNVFTFLQARLRKNTFCIYSLFGSICDILNIYVNLLPNYFSSSNILLSLIYDHLSCKLKIFGLVTIPQMSLNFLILSLIDRYSCSCHLTSPMRKIRDLRNVPYFTISIIILSSVMSLYGPLLYAYSPGLGCVCTDVIVNGISYLCVQGLLTPLVMFIFVCLTFRNTKRSRQRVRTMGTIVSDRTRHHFITTIVTQVLATSFFLLQWMIFYLYHEITLDQNRTDEEWSIHYFLFAVTNNIYFIANIKSFYLSTLTSRLFRDVLISNFIKLFTICQTRHAT